MMNNNSDMFRRFSADVVNQLSQKKDDYLETEIKTVLLEKGIKFNSQPEFYNFCKNNLTLLDAGPFKEVRLGYEDEINRGDLLFTISEETNFTHDGNTVNGEITISITKP